ncbi:MAG: DUF433 domain-containing protein [Methanophagales archaeon]|nr:DUF433 domain-containing protein [Methanophagales archaeon]
MSTKAVKERDMQKVQPVGVGWVKLDRITMNPEVMGGQPCIRGLRIPVSLIIRLIAAGRTNKEILEDYPELEEEDVKQSLEYAAWTVSERVLPVAL